MVRRATRVYVGCTVADVEQRSGRRRRDESTAEIMTDTGNASSIRVALKASNGRYVSAERGGSAPLRATQRTIGRWETFEMLYQGDGRVAFKAANGRYV